jgi:hypothetical protein
MSFLGSLRRILAGIVLLATGWLLLTTLASSGSTGGLVLGLVVVAAWGVSGIAVIAGKPWGRLLGLGVATAGLLVGWSLAAAGIGSPLAGVMFSPADAARWYVVVPAGYVFAAISVIAGLLLLLPFPRAAADGTPDAR